MGKNSPSFRWTAFATAGMFFVVQVVFAHRAEANFWSERRAQARQTASARGPFPSLVGPLLGKDAVLENVPRDVPPQIASVVSRVGPYGTLRRYYPSPDPNAPWVFHIQDAHGVPEAQRNLGQIIQMLVQDSDPLWVGVEGATGDFWLDPLKADPGLPSDRAVVDWFLQDGRLGGTEWAAFSGNSSIRLWGVENPQLYQQNLRALERSLNRQKELQNRLSPLEGQLEILKESHFPPALKSFDLLCMDHAAGRRSLSEYVSTLFTALSRTKGGDGKVGNFPEIQKMAEALRLESALDFKEVERERDRCLGRALERGAGEDLNRLLQKSLSHRSGQMGDGAFYRDFVGFLNQRGVSLRSFPQFDRYVAYTTLIDSIHREEFLRELPRGEKAVYELLAPTPDLKEKVQLVRLLRLIQRLGALSMTPEEWSEYKVLSSSGLSPLLSKISSTSLSVDWEALLRPFEEFCQKALDRNGPLAGHLLNQLEKSGVRRAVLVAGGFHTPGLVDILRKKNISVVVLTPHITEIKNQNPDFDVFHRQPLPLEQLFSGEKIFLNSPRLTAQHVEDKQVPQAQGLIRDFLATRAAALALAGHKSPGVFLKKMEKFSQTMQAPLGLSLRGAPEAPETWVDVNTDGTPDLVIQGARGTTPPHAWERVVGDVRLRYALPSSPAGRAGVFTWFSHWRGADFWPNTPQGRRWWTLWMIPFLELILFALWIPLAQGFSWDVLPSVGALAGIFAGYHTVLWSMQGENVRGRDVLVWFLGGVGMILPLVIAAEMGGGFWGMALVGVFLLHHGFNRWALPRWERGGWKPLSPLRAEGASVAWENLGLTPDSLQRLVQTQIDFEAWVKINYPYSAHYIQSPRMQERFSMFVRSEMEKNSPGQSKSDQLAQTLLRAIEFYYGDMVGESLGSVGQKAGWGDQVAALFNEWISPDQLKRYRPTVDPSKSRLRQSLERLLSVRDPVLLDLDPWSDAALMRSLRETTSAMSLELSVLYVTPDTDEGQLIGHEVADPVSKTFVKGLGEILRRIDAARNSGGTSRKRVLLLKNIESMEPEVRPLLNELLRIRRLDHPKWGPIVLPDNLQIVMTKRTDASLQDASFYDRVLARRIFSDKSQSFPWKETLTPPDNLNPTFVKSKGGSLQLRFKDQVGFSINPNLFKDEVLAENGNLFSLSDHWVDVVYRKTGLVLDRGTLALLWTMEKSVQEKNQVLRIEGPTSVGKTFAARGYSLLRDSGFMANPISEGSDLSDWIGNWAQNEDGQLYFNPFTSFKNRLESGGVVALSELNTLLDQNKKARLAWWLIQLSEIPSDENGFKTIPLTEIPTPPGHPVPTLRVHPRSLVVVDTNPMTYEGRGDFPDIFKEKTPGIVVEDFLNDKARMEFMAEVILRNPWIKKDRIMAPGLPPEEARKMAEAFVDSFAKGASLSVKNKNKEHFTLRHFKRMLEDIQWDIHLNKSPNAAFKRALIVHGGEGEETEEVLQILYDQLISKGRSVHLQLSPDASLENLLRNLQNLDSSIKIISTPMTRDTDRNMLEGANVPLGNGNRFSFRPGLIGRFIRKSVKNPEQHFVQVLENVHHLVPETILSLNEILQDGILYEQGSDSGWRLPTNGHFLMVSRRDSELQWSTAEKSRSVLLSYTEKSYESKMNGLWEVLQQIGARELTDAIKEFIYFSENRWVYHSNRRHASLAKFERFIRFLISKIKNIPSPQLSYRNLISAVKIAYTTIHTELNKGEIEKHHNLLAYFLNVNSVSWHGGEEGSSATVGQPEQIIQEAILILETFTKSNIEEVRRRLGILLKTVPRGYRWERKMLEDLTEPSFFGRAEFHRMHPVDFGILKYTFYILLVLVGTFGLMVVSLWVAPSIFLGGLVLFGLLLPMGLWNLILKGEKKIDSLNIVKAPFLKLRNGSFLRLDTGMKIPDQETPVKIEILSRELSLEHFILLHKGKAINDQFIKKLFVKMDQKGSRWGWKSLPSHLLIPGDVFLSVPKIHKLSKSEVVKNLCSTLVLAFSILTVVEYFFGPFWGVFLSVSVFMGMLFLSDFRLNLLPPLLRIPDLIGRVFYKRFVYVMEDDTHVIRLIDGEKLSLDSLLPNSYVFMPKEQKETQNSIHQRMFQKLKMFDRLPKDHQELILGELRKYLQQNTASLEWSTIKPSERLQPGDVYKGVLFDNGKTSTYVVLSLSDVRFDREVYKGFDILKESFKEWQVLKASQSKEELKDVNLDFLSPNETILSDAPKILRKRMGQLREAFQHHWPGFLMGNIPLIKFNIVESVAAQLGHRYRRISVGANTELSELIGRFHENAQGDWVFSGAALRDKEKSPRYRPPLLDYIANGGVLEVEVLDEKAFGVLAWLAPLLEGRSTVKIDEVPGWAQEIPVHPDFHLVLRWPKSMEKFRFLNVPSELGAGLHFLTIELPQTKSEWKNFWKEWVDPENKLEDGFLDNIVDLVQELEFDLIRPFGGLNKIPPFSTEDIRFKTLALFERLRQLNLGKRPLSPELVFVISTDVYLSLSGSQLVKDEIFRHIGIVYSRLFPHSNYWTEILKQVRKKWGKGIYTGAAIKVEARNAYILESTFNFGESVQLLAAPGARIGDLLTLVAEHRKAVLVPVDALSEHQEADILGGVHAGINRSSLGNLKKTSFEMGSVGRYLIPEGGPGRINVSDKKETILWLRHFDLWEDELKNRIKDLALHRWVDLEVEEGEWKRYYLPENIHLVSEIHESERNLEFQPGQEGWFQIPVASDSVDENLGGLFDFESLGKSELENVLRGKYRLLEDEALFLRTSWLHLLEMDRIHRQGLLSSEEGPGLVYQTAEALNQTIAQHTGNLSNLERMAVLHWEWNRFLHARFPEFFTKDGNASLKYDQKGRAVEIDGIPLVQGPFQGDDFSQGVSLRHTPRILNALAVLARADTLKRGVAMEGNTGAGKTSLAAYYAQLTGRRLVKFSNHRDSSHMDLGYSLEPLSGGRYQWIEKPVFQALREGNAVVLIDEANLNPEILGVLSAVLRGETTVHPLFPGGAPFSVGPHVLIVFTFNPESYLGRSKIDPVLLSFLIRLWLNVPDRDEYLHIVKGFYGEASEQTLVSKENPIPQKFPRAEGEPAIPSTPPNKAHSLNPSLPLEWESPPPQSRAADRLMRKGMELFSGGPVKIQSHPHNIFQPGLPFHTRFRAYDPSNFKQETWGIPLSSLQTVSISASGHLPGVQSHWRKTHDLFDGRYGIDFKSHHWHVLPSPGAPVEFLEVILTGDRNTPSPAFELGKDSMDNYFIRLKDAAGAFVVEYKVAVPAGYFGRPLPTGMVLQRPPKIGPEVNRALENMGIGPNETDFKTVVQKVASYCGSFKMVENGISTGKSWYSDVVESKCGVCRHRAGVFALTLHALGIRTRYVTNRVHAFAEVEVPGEGWVRVDLGGGGDPMSMDLRALSQETHHSRETNTWFESKNSSEEDHLYERRLQEALDVQGVTLPSNSMARGASGREGEKRGVSGPEGGGRVWKPLVELGADFINGFEKTEFIFRRILHGMYSQFRVKEVKSAKRGKINMLAVVRRETKMFRKKERVEKIPTTAVSAVFDFSHSVVPMKSALEHSISSVGANFWKLKKIPPNRFFFDLSFFYDGLQTVVPFGDRSDGPQFQKTLREMASQIGQNGTNLLGALRQKREDMMGFVESKNITNRIVILFTDGEDPKSIQDGKFTPAMTNEMDRYRESGLHLFVIGLGDATKDVGAFRDPLQNFIALRKDETDRISESIARFMELKLAGKSIPPGDFADFLKPAGSRSHLASLLPPNILKRWGLYSNKWVTMYLPFLETTLLALSFGVFYGSGVFQGSGGPEWAILSLLFGGLHTMFYSFQRISVTWGNFVGWGLLGAGFLLPMAFFGIWVSASLGPLGWGLGFLASYIVHRSYNQLVWARRLSDIPGFGKILDRWMNVVSTEFPLDFPKKALLEKWSKGTPLSDGELQRLFKPVGPVYWGGLLPRPLMENKNPRSLSVLEKELQKGWGSSWVLDRSSLLRGAMINVFIGTLGKHRLEDGERRILLDLSGLKQGGDSLYYQALLRALAPLKSVRIYAVARGRSVPEVERLWNRLEGPGFFQPKVEFVNGLENGEGVIPLAPLVQKSLREGVGVLEVFSEAGEAGFDLRGVARENLRFHPFHLETMLQEALNLLAVLMSQA